MSDIKVKNIKTNYVLKIIENVLHFKQYNDRNEVLRVAQAMAKTAMANENYSQTVKDAYLQAFTEIQDLSFEDMKEIIAITGATSIIDEDDNNDDNK